MFPPNNSRVELTSLDGKLDPVALKISGGVEPLIVVAEGHDRDAMKDPQVLRTMENFQRFLERDKDIGYSFSLTDILRTVNMVFHELEPKWGVIPNTVRDVGQTFFVFFANSPPTETAKYVTPDYQTAHVTFFARNHAGDIVPRSITRPVPSRIRAFVIVRFCALTPHAVNNTIAAAMPPM